MRVDGERVRACADDFAVFVVKVLDDEVTLAAVDHVCELQARHLVDEGTNPGMSGESITS